MEGTVIKLSKPISAQGDDRELSLSEPTLAILDDVELFSVKGDLSIKINSAICTRSLPAWRTSRQAPPRPSPFKI